MQRPRADVDGDRQGGADGAQHLLPPLRLAGEGLRFSFRLAHERIFGPVEEAGAGAEPWLERLATTLDAFFAAIAAEPLLAELCLLHSLGTHTGGEAFDRQAGTDVIATAIGGGRAAGREALGGDYLDPPSEVELFLAGAIVSVAVRRIRQEEIASLPAHRDELIRLVATPFLGLEGSRRIGRAPEAA